MYTAPFIALIVTAVLAVTAVVATLVADGAPAETDTRAGSVALALLLESVTATAAAAVPLSVIFPVDAPPPFNVLGVTVTDDRAGAFTVSVATLVTALSVAEMIAAVRRHRRGGHRERRVRRTGGGDHGGWRGCNRRVVLDTVTVAAAAAGAVNITLPVELFRQLARRVRE